MVEQIPISIYISQFSFSLDILHLFYPNYFCQFPQKLLAFFPYFQYNLEASQHNI